MSGAVGLLVVAIFGLAAGVGITAIGPGGVLVTVGLFVATGLSPAQVAGTAIVTHLATGALGSAAYHRSGQLRDRATRRIAVMLAATAVVGTPIGAYLNAIAPANVFGVLLAGFLVIVAALVWLRSSGGAYDETHPHHGATLLIPLGLAIAVAGGMFGVGGPLLTVPLLVVAGTPVLAALGAAQVQSIVIAGVGTLSYVARDAVDWRLAVVAGIPELVGVLIGWKLAHVASPGTLRRVMIVALVASAGLVGMHG